LKNFLSRKIRNTRNAIAGIATISMNSNLLTPARVWANAVQGMIVIVIRLKNFSAIVNLLLTDAV